MKICSGECFSGYYDLMSAKNFMLILCCCFTISLVTKKQQQQQHTSIVYLSTDVGLVDGIEMILFELIFIKMK